MFAYVKAAGAAPVLSYASMAEYFPKEVIGRANGALGVFDVGGAFLLQFITGLVIQQWVGSGGHYPPTAYQTAFALNIVLQVLALGWFLVPHGRARSPGISALFHRSTVWLGYQVDMSSHFTRKIKCWAAAVAIACDRTMNWQVAALGTLGIAVMLGCAIASSAGSSIIRAYVFETDVPNNLQLGDEPESPSIRTSVYGLQIPPRNTQSFAIDLVGVPERWLYDADDLSSREVRSVGDGAIGARSTGKRWGSRRHRRRNTCSASMRRYAFPGLFNRAGYIGWCRRSNRIAH